MSWGVVLLWLLRYDTKMWWGLFKQWGGIATTILQPYTICGNNTSGGFLFQFELLLPFWAKLPWQSSTRVLNVLIVLLLLTHNLCISVQKKNRFRILIHLLHKSMSSCRTWKIHEQWSSIFRQWQFFFRVACAVRYRMIRKRKGKTNEANAEI